MKTQSPREDRLDAWYDGSAICVIAVGSNGDPLDLAEHEVESLIQKLQRCLSEARNELPAKAIPSHAQLRFLLEEVCTKFGLCAASRDESRFLAAAARGDSAFVQELFSAEGMAISESAGVLREVGQHVRAAFKRWEEQANAT